MTIIAIDAMGGDQAPRAIIEGIFLFHQRCPHPAFLVYGCESLIRPLLKEYAPLNQVCELVHTSEAIDAHMKPSQALRGMPRASMRLALEAVAEKKACAAVSAGNTGAYLALSKTILKTLRDIDRPAIASQIPTEVGQSVMLDLGGTLDVSSRNLIEYALMGETFARCVLKMNRPKVGLLNVGKEDSKGSDRLQQAFSTLKESPLDFYGFIEGNDIPSGLVSVIVTDGFTGNIALKTVEGTARFMLSCVKKCFLSSLRGRLAAYIGRPLFKNLQQYFDPRIYNGALWLGLNSVAVKSHGSTDGLGFAHAIEMAYDMVQANIAQAIDESLVQWAQKISLPA